MSVDFFENTYSEELKKKIKDGFKLGFKHCMKGPTCKVAAFDENDDKIM